MNADHKSIIEHFLKIFFPKLRLPHNKLRQLIQNLIKLNLILILSQILIIPHRVLQFPLTIQQLIQIPQKQLKLRDVTCLLILTYTFDKYLVNRLETRNKISVHVLHLRIL